MTDKRRDWENAIRDGINEARAAKQEPSVFKADPNRPFEAAIHHAQGLIAGLKLLEQTSQGKFRFEEERDYGATCYRVTLNMDYERDRGGFEQKLLWIYPSGEIQARFSDTSLIRFPPGTGLDPTYEALKLTARHLADAGMIAMDTPAPSAQASASPAQAPANGNAPKPPAAPPASGWGKSLRRVFGR